jgi:UDP-N-acetylglucosamine--N-acetylmuramyl-(pentapeptide) pyrophosphoryl-undecaprenol N-acetylglucosamine transferase
MLARKFARYIAISYDEVASYFPAGKTALIGIPIRKVIAVANPDPFTTLGIPNDKPLIYVTGGSLGADRLNTLILTSLVDLLQNYRIFHQTGPAQEKVVTQTAQALIKDRNLLENYYVRGTLPAEAVGALLDAATLVISRAGSTTIFEIAQHHKPSIIVPIPEEISHDQRTNAYAYARTGAATVLEESNLTPHLLTSEIQSIIEDTDRYQKMQIAAESFSRPDAARKIAEILVSIGLEHG